MPSFRRVLKAYNIMPLTSGILRTHNRVCLAPHAEVVDDCLMITTKMAENIWLPLTSLSYTDKSTAMAMMKVSRERDIASKAAVVLVKRFTDDLVKAGLRSSEYLRTSH